MPLNFTRSWMDDDLNQWRDTCARFVEEELVADDEAARKRGNVGRGLWTKAGALGLLCRRQHSGAGDAAAPAPGSGRRLRSGTAGGSRSTSSRGRQPAATLRRSTALGWA
jgi:hypothetical protein